MAEDETVAVIKLRNKETNLGPIEKNSTGKLQI